MGVRKRGTGGAGEAELIGLKMGLFLAKMRLFLQSKRGCEEQKLEKASSTDIRPEHEEME
jgi:hypothetical protein